MSAVRRFLAGLVSLAVAAAPAAAAAPVRVVLPGAIPLVGAPATVSARPTAASAAPAISAAVAPLAPAPVAFGSPAAVSAPAARAEFGALKTGSVAASIRAHAAARGFDFGASDDATLEAAPSAADAPRSSSPKRSARLPGSLRSALGGLFGASAAVEALGLAVPQYARERFGFGALAAVSAASSLALGVGSLIGGWAVERFGPEKTYVGTLAARAAATGTLAALYAAGALTSPALVAVFAADYVLHYANYVALDALAPRHLGDDAAGVNRFGLIRQFGVDAIGLLGPLAAGLAVAARGYGAVFAAGPALFAASALSGLAVLRARPSSAETPAAAPSAGWAETLRSVRRDPVLTGAIAGFALLNVASLSLYFMIAPAYGGFAAAATGGSAARISSLMTASFAGGGIAGAWIQSRVTRAVEKDAAGDDAAAARGLARRMGAALSLAGVSLLSFWSLPLHAPIAAVSALMAAFGAAFTVSSVGLLSIVALARPQTRAKTLGLNRFAAMIAAFAFLNAGGLALARLSPTGVAGPAAFSALAGAMTALGAAAVFVGARLRRAVR